MLFICLRKTKKSTDGLGGMSREILLLIFAFWIMTFFIACGSKQLYQPSSRPLPRRQISSLGYVIQVGAFAKVSNARRLTANLERNGLEAYYFHKAGLYKVRFGNFSTQRAAEARAKSLKKAGYISDYYIVRPQSFVQSRSALREKIVQTAREFIGLPYEWGGTRAEEGFDCSGLTMAVYRLNGLNLPRTSRQQYRAGTPVGRYGLEKGDLVFFTLSPKGRISHVGVYAGNGRFIHAPSTGKTVGYSSLSSRYYQNAFAGGRAYIQD